MMLDLAMRRSHDVIFFCIDWKSRQKHLNHFLVIATSPEHLKLFFTVFHEISSKRVHFDFEQKNARLLLQV